MPIATPGRGDQGKAERGAHEGRGARGRDDRRQHSGEEGAGHPRPGGQPAARIAQRQAETGRSRKAQPHREDQIGEHRDKDRRLQLKAPADRLAAGAQRQQRAAERGKAREHPGGIGEPVSQLLGAMPVRLSGEAQQLQGQDREYAGHRVEHDAAEKSQQQRLPPARPLSAGIAGTGLALISNARSAPSSPRSNSTPSRVAGAVRAAGSAAFFSTISSPSPRRLDFGLGGGIDQRAIGRKKHAGRVAQPGERGRRNQQPVIALARGKPRLERRRNRQALPRGGEQRGDGLVGGGRRGGDRQVQRQLGCRPGCRCRRRRARTLPPAASRSALPRDPARAVTGTSRLAVPA